MATVITTKPPPLDGFTMPLMAGLAAMFGFVVGNVYAQPWLGAFVGLLLGAGVAALVLANIHRYGTMALGDDCGRCDRACWLAALALVVQGSSSASVLGWVLIG